MSAAFRNFILTFIIMLLVFGFIAYKALPDIRAVLFPEPEVSAEESSEPAEESSGGENTSSESSSDEQPAVEDNVFECIIAAKNDAGAVCSLIFVSVSELNKTYTVCRIPVDLHVKDGGIYRTLASQLGANNADYMLRKLSPLVGRELRHYINCNTDSLVALVSAAEKAGSHITVNIPYQVRYLDPSFIDIEDKSEEMYKTLSGSVMLDTENIGPVFNSYADDQSVTDYYFQDSTLGMSIFHVVCSIAGIGTDTTTLAKLHGSVRTDIPLSDVLKYSRLLFAYSLYSVKQVTYPSAYYSSNKVTVKIPNWQKGIKDLAAEEEK